MLSMLELACEEAGFDCDVVFTSSNEDDLLKQVRVHAHAVHSFEEDDFTPELQRKIKTLIHRS